MEDRALLEGLLAATIAGFRRLRYVHQGVVDDEGGSCEISLSDGLSLVLRVGAAGMTLVVEQGPWLDPFTEPLTPQNLTWVETHGRWQAVDVSDEIPFASFVGQRIDDLVATVDERVTRGGGWTRTLRSVCIRCGQKSLTILADFDEIEVTIEPKTATGES